ncbi:MAG: hypothetical protein ACI4XH_03750 [Acutalibacteraceae bacterium]
MEESKFIFSGSSEEYEIHLYSDLLAIIDRNTGNLLKCVSALKAWDSLYIQIRELMSNAENKMTFANHSVMIFNGHSSRLGYYIYKDSFTVLNLKTFEQLSTDEALKSWDNLNRFITE